MRVFLLILCASMMTMCKSRKSTIPVPTDIYIVQLNETSYPERVSAQLKQPVQAITPMRNDIGRFKFSFPITEESESIKKDLLNLDLVIAVWTEEEYEKMNAPKAQKSVKQQEAQKQ